MWFKNYGELYPPTGENITNEAGNVSNGPCGHSCRLRP